MGSTTRRRRRSRAPYSGVRLAARMMRSAAALNSNPGGPAWLAFGTGQPGGGVTGMLSPGGGDVAGGLGGGVVAGGLVAGGGA